VLVDRAVGVQPHERRGLPLLHDSRAAEGEPRRQAVPVQDGAIDEAPLLGEEHRPVAFETIGVVRRAEGAKTELRLGRRLRGGEAPGQGLYRDVSQVAAEKGFVGLIKGGHQRLTLLGAQFTAWDGHGDLEPLPHVPHIGAAGQGDVLGVYPCRGEDVQGVGLHGPVDGVKVVPIQGVQPADVALDEVKGPGRHQQAQRGGDSRPQGADHLADV